MPRSPKTRTTLADVGESALIARISRLAGRTPGRDWALRIGDDAAILRPRKGEELVLSVDAQVEGTHFRFGREGAGTIGRRAMAVNLSDLAAMGARPVGALLSLCAPADGLVSDFDGIVRGFVAEGARVGCPLVGGNLSRAPGWSLEVTVVGGCVAGKALRRRGVRPGDELFVTGVLGRGALARMRADADAAAGGAGRLSYVPVPRIEAGRRLARLKGARACLDVSDGLATDLENLLAGDGFGAEMEVGSLPSPRGFFGHCRALGVDPLEVQTLGGEDYELLFAFRSTQSSDVSGMLSKRLGVPVTRIGAITRKKGVRGLPTIGEGHHF
jgi:thiamine-monophosphate kinase